MRTALVLPLLFALAAPLGAEQVPTTVESRADAVTLLPDAARVTRSLTLNLDANAPAEVLVPGLPAGLDSSSLMVLAADEESTARLLRADVRLGRTVVPPPSERVESLRQRLDEARADKAMLDAKSQALGIRLEAIRALGKGLGEQTLGSDALGGFEWLEEIEIRALAVLSRQRELAAEREVVAQRIDELERELALIDQRRQGSRVAVLNLVARDGGPVNLHLEYRHPRAGWSPVYEADLDTETGALQWRTRALVRQHTGEDWRDVRMTIGMSDRRSWRPVPELSSWEIGFAEPPRHRVMEAPAPDAMVMPAPAMAPSLGHAPVLEGSAYALQYRLPGQWDIDSGTDERLLDLHDWRSEARVSIRSAPRMAASAVVVARLPFAGESALPPGSLRLFRDGQRIGEQPVRDLMPDRELTLSFGVDPAIEVHYDAAPEQRDERGLIGRHKKISREATIRVINRHDEHREVLVLDRLPVGLDADIAVTTASGNTPPSQRDFEGQEGVDAWRRQLAPGEEWQIRFGYVVTWPADKDLRGL